MTPEEKAKELIEKFMPFCYRVNEGASIHVENAKQCAEICVKEIIDNHVKHFDDAFPNVVAHWNKVLEQIQKP